MTYVVGLVSMQICVVLQGGFIFRRLSEEHRRSVEMRQGAHHGLPESETHHLTGGVPEDSILP